MARRKKKRTAEDGYKKYLFKDSQTRMPRSTIYRLSSINSVIQPASELETPASGDGRLSSTNASSCSQSWSSATSTMTQCGSQEFPDQEHGPSVEPSSSNSDQYATSIRRTSAVAPMGSQQMIESSMGRDESSAIPACSHEASDGLGDSHLSSSSDDGGSVGDRGDPSSDPDSSDSDSSDNNSNSSDDSEASDSDENNENSDNEQSDSEVNVWAQLRKENEKLKTAKFMKGKYHLDSPLTTYLSITKFDTLLMVFEFAMHHGVSNVGLLDLLKMINTIFSAQVLPESLFIFDRIFQGDLEVTYHFFCKNCSNYIGTYKYLKKEKISSVDCDLCGTKCAISKANQGNFFITFPMRDQIKNYLESVDGMDDYLHQRNVRNNEGKICDIMDGEIYRNLLKDGDIEENDITLTCSTDGAAIYLSEHNTMWPIQFRINELPPNLRNSADNMFLAGLWFGEKDPKMHSFLKVFAEECHDLYHNKIKWVCNGKSTESRVLVLNYCLDSVAKPHVQNCMMFNARMGCMYCFHPTHPTEGGRRYGVRNSRDYETAVCDQFYEERSDQDMWEDLAQADAQPGQPVRGVKGFTPLMVIPNYHPVFSYSIDYMHNSLLGVSRQLAKLWFKEKFHDMPHYIKQKMDQIDSRLLRLKPPSNITRRPRSVKKYKKYKASEWRSWLLYYSLPCLKDILPERYYKHLILFVSAMFILLQSSITATDLDLADHYLKNFIVNFEILYGKEQMTYNVHLLSHLGCVKLWGPLWSYSAFAFETGIGALKLLVKGTTNVLSQITTKYLRKKSIHGIKNLYNIDASVLEFCSDLGSAHHVKEADYFDDGTVLLGPTVCCPLTEDELQILEDANIVDAPDDCYVRMIFKKVMYHSSMYKKSKKADDTTVLLDSGDYAKILRIFVHEGVVSLIVRGLNVSRAAISSHRIGACAAHIKVCERYAFGNFAIVKPSNIVKKSIFLQTSPANTYVTDFPNLYEKD